MLPTPSRLATAAPTCADPAATLLRLLAHPNIASKEHIIRRYDHEIRGATVVRPLVGAAHDGHADGVVLAEPSDTHGLAIGIGVNPWYGITDPEHMAHAAVDEAIRNVVAVGADPSSVALLDNFSWGDPRRPSTLGELVAAVRGCCEAAAAFRAPFVSGKDSLNNEYLGSDGARHAVPPTLVITAIAHHPNADLAVTPDLKLAGDVLVLVGRTETEFGGSHFGLVTDESATSPVPSPDNNSPARYRALHLLLRTGRIRACHDLSEGGLAVALAEMSMAGRLGANIDTLPSADVVTALFSESTGRFVCEVAPDDVTWFVEGLGEPAIVLGTVIDEPVLRLAGFDLAMDEMRSAFQGDPR